MLTKLCEGGEGRLAWFHVIKNFPANEIYQFSRLFTKQVAFLPGQPTPYNQLLIQQLLLFPEWYFA